MRAVALTLVTMCAMVPIVAHPALATAEVVADSDVVREIEDLASLGDIQARALGGFRIDRSTGSQGPSLRDFSSGRAQEGLFIETPRWLFQRLQGPLRLKAARMVGRPSARYERSPQGSLLLAVSAYDDGLPLTWDAHVAEPGSESGARSGSRALSPAAAITSFRQALSCRVAWQPSPRCHH